MKKLIVASLLLVFSSSLFAQCPYRYGATEDDSLKCLEQMTNFQMFYKAKNYKDSYEAWQYIVNQCPCAWDGVYTNAQTMFQNLIKAETDSAKENTTLTLCSTHTMYATLISQRNSAKATALDSRLTTFFNIAERR